METKKNGQDLFEIKGDLKRQDSQMQWMNLDGIKD